MAETIVSRDEAIAILRENLVALSQPDKSTCEIVRERGILCRGFDRYSNADLRAVFAHVGGLRPSLSRADVEKRAAMAQLATQRERGTATCCDAQWQLYESCHGWDDFSNEDLERFCREIGREVVVMGEKSLAAI